MHNNARVALKNVSSKSLCMQQIVYSTGFVGCRTWDESSIKWDSVSICKQRSIFYDTLTVQLLNINIINI